MGLVTELYQGRKASDLVSPDKRGRDRIRQVHGVLLRRLEKELRKKHIWIAACTVAVRAGMWRGSRFRNRRVKLLGIINDCRLFLGESEIVPEEGWYNNNICDGYGAYCRWKRMTGMSTEATMWTSVYILTRHRINDGGGGVFEEGAKLFKEEK